VYLHFCFLGPYFFPNETFSATNTIYFRQSTSITYQHNPLVTSKTGWIRKQRVNTQSCGTLEPCPSYLRHLLLIALESQWFYSCVSQQLAGWSLQLSWSCSATVMPYNREQTEPRVGNGDGECCKGRSGKVRVGQRESKGNEGRATLMETKWNVFLACPSSSLSTARLLAISDFSADTGNGEERGTSFKTTVQSAQKSADPDTHCHVDR
jgi:hypothetical protein